MFIPKSSKYQNSFRGKPIKRIYKQINYPNIINGNVALKVLSPGLVSAQQLQAIRLVIAKIMKKTGKFIIFPFPNARVSVKPSGARMGKGKGVKVIWVSLLQAGSLFCIIYSSFIDIAKKALKAAQHRMPVATKIITNYYN